MLCDLLVHIISSIAPFHVQKISAKVVPALIARTKLLLLKDQMDVESDPSSLSSHIVCLRLLTAISKSSSDLFTSNYIVLSITQ